MRAENGVAGDWIPMRTDLAEDPAVIAIAAATDLDEFAVVGRPIRVGSALRGVPLPASDHLEPSRSSRRPENRSTSDLPR